jgi:site-specific DNA recombinase
VPAERRAGAALCGDPDTGTIVTVKPRALLYARVSTADKGQDWTAQQQELRLVAAQRGWEVVDSFHDVTSGTKADRPGLAAAVGRARRGGVDIFAAVATDRIARSVRNLLDLVDELEACGVKLACTREGAMDTTTPQGRAFMQTRAVFAELERNLTSERVREGLAVRRARGVQLGRPRTIDHQLIPLALQLRAKNRSWSTIARELGGSPGAWSAALKRAA